MGILLIHIEIQFIAEGAVLLKGGQGIHRDNFAANGVPITGTPDVLFREFRCALPKLRLSGLRTQNLQPPRRLDRWSLQAQ